MQLDDLKTAWAAHGTLLEKNLRINERLLREVMARKIRSSLAPYLLWRALEAVAGLVVIALVGGVLGAHLGELRYVAMAGIVLAFAVAVTATTIYLLLRAIRLDYSGPLTEVQLAVERLKRIEYRAFKWALLGGIVVWLPAALVLFEALFTVNALARVDLAWLASNVVFGLSLLWLGQLLSRRYVERPDLGPWARRLVDRVSGRSLESVDRHLAELASLARDEAS